MIPQELKDKKVMNIKKLPISVVILTQNEELNIEFCLKSIAVWVGEIFIIDSGSTDRTLEIASLYTNNIIYHPFENYSRQRNWAQENLKLNYDWVFHIDADERVSKELQSKLIHFYEKINEYENIAGLLVRRRIKFMGKHIRYGGIYPTYHCRIFKRNSGRCEEREYDQHFIINGPTLRIEADLIEVTANSLFQWTARHNRWAEMEAQHLLQKKLGSGKNLIKPRIIGSPIERRRWFRSYYEKTPIFLRVFIYFCIRYFIRLGFLDGVPGLIYHFLHGFWFRFYVDACYYELKNKAN